MVQHQELPQSGLPKPAQGSKWGLVSEGPVNTSMARTPSGVLAEVRPSRSPWELGDCRDKCVFLLSPNDRCARLLQVDDVLWLE